MSASPSISNLKQAAIESAEQWVIECSKCHHTAPAMERGIFRAWASSTKKRVLARCTSCNKYTFARLTKDPVRACTLRIEEIDAKLASLKRSEL